MHVCAFLMGNTAKFLPMRHSALKIVPGEMHEHLEHASL